MTSGISGNDVPPRNASEFDSETGNRTTAFKSIAAIIEPGRGAGLAADAFDRAMSQDASIIDPDAWHGTLDDEAIEAQAGGLSYKEFSRKVEQIVSAKANPIRGETVPFTLFRDIDPAPKKDWLVDELLGAGELSVFYGAPGCGKSVLAGDAACHVAAGRDWHGRPVRPGAVLYVAAERGGLVKRRLAAWRAHHGIHDIPLAIVTGFFDLCTSETDTRKLLGTIQSLADATTAPVVWVIIDTVAQVLAGGDENSGRDMGALVSNLARIQTETGAHVTVIHHVPHAEQQRMRGHGALLGAADTAIRVESDAEKPCHMAKIEKANDGPDTIAVGFTLASVTLSVDEKTGRETTAPVVVPADAPNSGRTSKNVRMSDSVSLALRCLQDLAADGSHPHPNIANIPNNVRCVRVDDWRNICYRSHISGSTEPDAHRMAFKRAMEKLKAQRMIGSFDEWVWIA